MQKKEDKKDGKEILLGSAALVALAWISLLGQAGGGVGVAIAIPTSIIVGWVHVLIGRFVATLGMRLEKWATMSKKDWKHNDQAIAAAIWPISGPIMLVGFSIWGLINRLFDDDKDEGDDSS